MTYILKSSLLEGHYPEETFRVKSLHNYLPADKAAGRKSALVQFFDQDSGGLRTVRARDIIRIR